MFYGKENATSAKKMQEGEDAILTGYGQSMTPILKSGQSVEVGHLTDDISLKKNDIVFCKVNGHYYLHKIHSVKNDRFLIGNNHGHMNGWIGRNAVFGKVTKIL